MYKFILTFGTVLALTVLAWYMGENMTPETVQMIIFALLALLVLLVTSVTILIVNNQNNRDRRHERQAEKERQARETSQPQAPIIIIGSTSRPPRLEQQTNDPYLIDDYSDQTYR